MGIADMNPFLYLERVNNIGTVGLNDVKIGEV